VRQARMELASYLRTTAITWLFVSNATFAVNQVAWSLKLGRETVLLTDHEYGSRRADLALSFPSAFGFRCKVMRLPWPLKEP